MNLSDLIWFLVTFIIVYLFYVFIYVLRKNSKYNPNKVPLELVYLIRKYRLDMKKINYKKIMNVIGLISAFDIAFVGTFVFCFVKNIYLSIIVGGIMLIPLIIITFGFVGRYYEKRGMVINGNKKN